MCIMLRIAVLASCTWQAFSFYMTAPFIQEFKFTLRVKGPGLLCILNESSKLNEKVLSKNKCKVWLVQDLYKWNFNGPASELESPRPCTSAKLNPSKFWMNFIIVGNDGCIDDDFLFKIKFEVKLLDVHSCK